MRRWMAAAVVSAALAGCSVASVPPTPGPASTAASASVATPSGPTPSLPIAIAVSPVPSPSAGASPVAANAQAAGQAFALQSPAFTASGSMPADFTCDGAGMSPPLSWSGPPLGTGAFALIEQDTDTMTNGEPFTQWLLYNIPTRVTQLSAGLPASPMLSNGSQQGKNSSSTIGYIGPCPKQGDPPHHFSFQLFAQDGYVTIETGADIAAVQDALNGHVVGQTQLVVTFQR